MNDLFEGLFLSLNGNDNQTSPKQLKVNLEKLLNELINLSFQDPTSTKLTPTKLQYLLSKEPNYNSFVIPKKKAGEVRQINAPDKNTKFLHWLILNWLTEKFTPKKAANGFVKGRSIVTNAQLHVNKTQVLNIDVKNFFDSISSGRVYTVLQLPPFSLDEKAAGVLTNICTFNSSLPQGASTSPILSNAICQNLDRKLIAYAAKKGFHYSRYADDLTFSCDRKIFNKDVISNIITIIQKEGFKINVRKSRLQEPHQRQVVTGLVVNEKINVSRKYIRNIRAMLHSWEKYGFLKAEEIYLTKTNQNNIKTLDNINSIDKILYNDSIKDILSYNSKFLNHLHGKVLHLGFVRGKNDSIYLKYKEQFNKLSKRDAKISNNLTSITNAIPLSTKETKVEKNYEHNPLKTIEFLRLFRDPNNSGLRDLVHKPINPNDFNFVKSLKEAENSINNLPWKMPINQIIKKELINKIYKVQGRRIWEKEKKHPLFNAEFAKSINQFKKRYRFGSNPTDSTIFQELFLKKIKTTKEVRDGKELQYQEGQVVFNNPEYFSADADFLTDVETVGYALEKIIRTMISKTNYEGSMDFDFTEKKIEVSSIFSKTEEGHYYSEIIIVDKNSYANTRPFKMLQGGDIQGAKQNLRSLCDWTIEAFFMPNKNYLSIPVLPEVPKNYSYSTIPPTEGFTHRLRFYH